MIKRYFECRHCSFSFTVPIKEGSSGVMKCRNESCGRAVLEYRLRIRPPGIPDLTDEQILAKMPNYTQVKYYWINHPQAWEANIKSRKIQNKEGGNLKQQYDIVPEIIQV